MAKQGPCWDGYVMEGMKKSKKSGKMVPNCVRAKKKLGPTRSRKNDRSSCPMSSSHDEEEKKVLHFERPKTQKEAYWEERCEKILNLLVV